MKACPYCQASEQQVKNGRNPSGSQWYKCQVCKRTYTLEPMPAGYDASTREQAVRLYLEEMDLRRTGRILA